MDDPNLSDADQQRRTEVILFRATPDERHQIEEAAVAAGLTKSAYIRRAAIQDGGAA